MITVTEPGLWELDAADYHGDPCPTASLNNSLIGPLLEAPRLAWQAHPQLNPLWAPDEDKKFDLGSAAHVLLLGRGRDFEIFDAPDWNATGMGKGAKTDLHEKRDAARLAGKIPLLEAQYKQATEMAGAASAQLQHFDFSNPFDLSTGKCEIGLFWEENGVWCRNLIDRLRDDLPQWEIWDYKTTATNINPESLALSTHIVSMGYDTQCAFQERGLITLYPELAGRLKFRWLFQSTEPPYLISVVEPDPATMTIARKKVDYAINRWRECLTANEWPGYPRKVMPLRHAEFLASRWLEREIAEHDAGTLAPPPPPPLKRKPGRPKKPNHPVTDLSGG